MNKGGFGSAQPPEEDIIEKIFQASLIKLNFLEV